MVALSEYYSVSLIGSASRYRRSLKIRPQPWNVLYTAHFLWLNSCRIDSHVQQLAADAVQQLRITYRWEAIDHENKEIELARDVKQPYLPDVVENGDSPKQLLARSRYLLFKDESNWTPSQVQWAEILFAQYPELEKAYRLSRKLSYIFSKTSDKSVGLTKLARWYDEVERSGIKAFDTVSRTILPLHLIAMPAIKF